MPSYRVVALSKKVADQVRHTLKAPDYGHPAHTEVARGYGPCRECLKTFHIGEENRILFTYNPFRGIGKLPLPGPIFIHEQSCDRYPEDAGYPSDLLGHAAVFDAYSISQKLTEQIFVAANEDKERALEELLKRPEVDYVEVRDGEAGCFDFRVEPLGRKVFEC